MSLCGLILGAAPGVGPQKTASRLKTYVVERGHYGLPEVARVATVKASWPIPDEVSWSLLFAARTVVTPPPSPRWNATRHSCCWLVLKTPFLILISILKVFVYMLVSLVLPVRYVCTGLTELVLNLRAVVNFQDFSLFNLSSVSRGL